MDSRISGTRAVHSRGVAGAGPLRPGQTEQARRLAQELDGLRRHELVACCRRHALDALSLWLVEDRDEATLVFVVDGPSPGGFMATLAGSDAPFDRWLAGQLSQLYRSRSLTGTPELLLAWHEAARD